MTRPLPRKASAVLRWLFRGTDDLRRPGPVRDAIAYAERDERLAFYGLRLARAVRRMHEGDEGVHYDEVMRAMVAFEQAEDGLPVPRRKPQTIEVYDAIDAARIAGGLEPLNPPRVVRER